MATTTSYHKPTKAEQKLAQASYEALAQSLKEITTKSAEVEIEETQEKMKVPLYALHLLADILDSMSKGKPISIVPLATELTTQAAAEHLGCSRPHLVKLLETGKIPYTLVGRHRRVKFDDIMNYKEKIKKEQKAKLIEIMKADEEAGLYDS